MSTNALAILGDGYQIQITPEAETQKATILTAARAVVAVTDAAIAAGEQLGGKAVKLGDAAVELTLLKQVPMTVVMPEAAVDSKVAACLEYGADVVLHGAHVGESLERLEELRAIYGDSAATFRAWDSADLEKQARYWLTHDDARERARAAQWEAVRPHHWGNRALDILNIILN